MFCRSDAYQHSTSNSGQEKGEKGTGEVGDLHAGAIEFEASVNMDEANVHQDQPQ